MPDAMIPAATILLLRDRPQLEVLMVERHADITFAGGAMVFPGGKLAPGDYDDRWTDYCFATEYFDDGERVARIAAVREAFEETGILLARDADGGPIDPGLVESLDGMRRAVEANDRLFLDLIADAGIKLALDDITLFARWAPPRGAAHKRFDTWFFAARSPADQAAREDGNEATAAVWTTPERVLADCRDGRRKMIFPTIRNVELLGLSATASEAIAFANERKIERVEPEIVERDGARFLTIPQDLGYPVTEEPLETAFRS